MKLKSNPIPEYMLCKIIWTTVSKSPIFSRAGCTAIWGMGAAAQPFHPDGTIEITWFEGLASDFVEGSIRMGASDVRTKHLIGTPVVTFNANATRAIVETNAMIIAEHVKLNLGCIGHNRFYDMAEKRDGVWKLFHRQSIYDMASFTFRSA